MLYLINVTQIKTMQLAEHFLAQGDYYLVVVSLEVSVGGESAIASSQRKQPEQTIRPKTLMIDAQALVR